MQRLVVFVLACSSALLPAACSLGDAAEPDSGGVSRSDVYPARRLRRLGSRELAHSVLDVTGIAVPDSRVAALFSHRKLDNGDPDAWVTRDVLAAAEDLAWFVADEVVRTRPARVFDGCSSALTCRAHILRDVLRRVYRRDLTSEEATTFDALWEEAANGSDAAGSGARADDGLRAVLAAALQSPLFLYREEVGRRVGTSSVALLDPREIAPQLSFLITGGPPDDILLDAARDDRLLDPNERVTQATRLLATPAAAALQRHFLELYLATAELPEIGKSPKVYPGFRGEPLAADLRVMLDAVVSDGGSTRALLSRPHDAGGALASTYASGPPIAGVLMHPAFLATHGGFDQSNPIARGLFVLTSLLCAAPPAPPPGIPRAPSDKSTTTTTRSKFSEHSRGSCQTCHQAIDGIGFGFEAYDGTGKFRATDNGFPVDDTGLLPADGEQVPYAGVGALGARLATSQQVADCFGRHVVRFALGAGERAGEKRLYVSLASGSTPDTTYDERVVHIVASDAFVKRRVQ